MPKTGAEIFEKYNRRMGAATQDIQRGVETTTKDQAAAAIAAKDLMKQKLMEALDRGDYEAGLLKSGHAKWKRNMIEKGLGKITAGINANKSEITAQFQKVADIGEQVRNEVSAMPKGTIDDALNRVRRSMEIQKSGWGKT